MKEQFEESKAYMIDGFDTVMDYVITSELDSESRPDDVSFGEYMARKLSFRYGSKDYARINNAIGK